MKFVEGTKPDVEAPNKKSILDCTQNQEPRANND